MHLSIRRIRTLIIFLFISIVLILTFSALFNKDSINNKNDTSFADSIANAKDMKNELDLDNENEIAEDDFTKEMNKGADENDIDDANSKDTNINPAEQQEKENFIDNDNNFDSNDNNIDINDDGTENNINSKEDNSIEDNENDLTNDKSIEGEKVVDGHNNPDDVDYDNTGKENNNDDKNIENEATENDKEDEENKEDKESKEDKEDKESKEDNGADNAIDDNEIDKTLIGESDNNKNDDAKNDDENNDNKEDVGDDTKEDVGDDTKEDVGDDNNEDVGDDNNEDVGDDNNEDIGDDNNEDIGDDNNEDVGDDNNEDVGDDNNDGDNTKEDDGDDTKENNTDESKPKSKKEVEFKLYHDGSNYRDGDDPEGKDCPVAWKWVDKQSESDIIAMNILDNLSDINRIERYSYDKDRQKLLLMSMESTSNYKVMITKKKYFDYIIDYRLDSDVPIPYTYDFFDFTKQPLPLKEKGKDGRGLAAVFISNCNATNKRLEFLKELMKHTKIDSYGMCAHNKDPYEEDEDKSSWGTKMNTIRKYKFTLAFENSNDRDYVTEKFFQPLEAGSVPVFYGTSNIADFAPEHSFINANDFESAKELAEYLEHLDKNDDEYEAYLEWKKKAATGDLGDNLNHLVEIRKMNSICQLLQRIKNMWINPYLKEWDRKDVPKDERACGLC